MKNETTTFTVTVVPQRARCGTMENVVEEALRAVIGFNSDVDIAQVDDTTLEINIHPRKDWLEDGPQPMFRRTKTEPLRNEGMVARQRRHQREMRKFLREEDE